MATLPPTAAPEDFAARLRASRVPPRIGDMYVPPALLEAYRGHEALLARRAAHPPHCRAPYDALRLCWLGAGVDAEGCARAVEAYRPCARELRAARAARLAALEHERRVLLAARSAALAGAAAAGGGGGAARG